MHNKILIFFFAVIIIVTGFFAFGKSLYTSEDQTPATSHKDATYTINGEAIKLTNGVSEIEAAPGSASKIITRYFGNEVMSDLDGDGKDDVVFLLTQQTGGSGTFYYVVAALNKETGYVGSEGLLLGDRIAPQTTEISRNPSHKNVIVVNYAERAPGEPMTTQPSVGKSIWIKLDPQTMQFGEVVQDFEGEADPSKMTLEMHTWSWISTLYNDERNIVPKQAGQFTVTFSGNERFSAKTDCNAMGGTYIVSNGTITFKDMVSTKMFCEGSQETEFAEMLANTTSYHFTSRGELILDLKFDSGSVTFR